jgi:hypothetical protein
MIEPATAELLALAGTMRGEDWANDLAAALAAAKNAGWEWPKAFLYATRLMADKDALPRELTTAASGPRWPANDVPASAEVRHAALALMRAALPQDGAE